NLMRMIDSLSAGLNELHPVIIQRHIQRQQLSLQRHMMDADKNPSALRVIFDLIEQNCRIRFVARIDLGDGTHLEVQIRPFDPSKFSQFAYFLSPTTPSAVLHSPLL